jgi:hypothetical protein
MNSKKILAGLIVIGLLGFAVDGEHTHCSATQKQATETHSALEH